jgi:hypothetical protein
LAIAFSAGSQLIPAKASRKISVVPIPGNVTTEQPTKTGVINDSSEMPYERNRLFGRRSATACNWTSKRFG